MSGKRTRYTKAMVYNDVKIDLTVIQSQQLDESTMTVYFERPIGFVYEPGDWIDLQFDDEQLKGGITYSLSSSPSEPTLAITFRTGISPFKRRLQSLTAGDSLYISQYGNDYGFHLKDNRSSVLVAGGIGIAPFRSMLKEMHDTGNSNDVHLVYIDKGEPYVFADEIDTWKGAHRNIRVDYVKTRDLNRKKREKLLLELISRDAHQYFIAGPEGMVESTEHLLIDNGVSAKDIRIDSFGGY